MHAVYIARGEQDLKENTASHISHDLRASGTEAGKPAGTIPTSFGFIAYTAGKEPVRHLPRSNNVQKENIGDLMC